MSDTDPTNLEGTLVDDGLLAPLIHAGLSTVDGAVNLIDLAIANGIAAADPFNVGDHGLARLNGDGALEVIDVRQYEDEPRLPSFITRVAEFVSVDSLARYVARYQDEHATVAYITDPYGRGLSMLTTDTKVADVQIDDHPEHDPGEEVTVGRRAHRATLVLRPTEPARRWGKALASTALAQEEFLDLIVDGITEIADPDGAVLRDLVQDLHAIRTSEVTSVIRTGGEGSIQLKEIVQLHAGRGTTVTFPEQMTVTFLPFVTAANPIVLTVRIKPHIGDSKVRFSLSCAHLDDQLAHTVGDIAAAIAEHTELNPLWRP